MTASLLTRALVLCLGACVGAATAAPTLQPYRDEAELTAALERWRSAAQRLVPRRQALPAGTLALSMAAADAAPPAPAPATAVARAEGDTITNVQTAGVDEGGIVKRAGDHLVVLRRGRLFTVRVGGDQLQPVARIDAYAPGSDPAGAWYDELLVSGSDVVVIGYSYARGGTEVGLFELGSQGQLRYRATFHLRGADYYSARNYASRLVGRRLVFYTPTQLRPWSGMPTVPWMPAWRRWQPQLPEDFERLLPATRIFRTDDDFDPTEPLALHTVTGCDLDRLPLRCASTAVLGPAARVFHVSAGSVYVWTTSRGGRDGASIRSAVFRLPLDGGAPTGLKTAGVPVDTLSFLEDGQGQLNVLLREQGGGEGMWHAAGGAGGLALLRVPLSDFGDGRTAAARERYRRLPGPLGGEVQNRYVGDWLLWGDSAGAWALRPAAGSADPQPLAPGHAVERIEAIGGHALLVGNAGADLHFTAVRLDPGGARLAGRHVQPATRQGETRTHGFFYRATGEDGGLLGLPVTSDQQRGRTVAAAVVFLQQRGLSFAPLGTLDARAGPRTDDACKASCTDWYGNARPVFLGERVLALLGYELVEGRVARGGLEELRRVSFAPPGRHRGDRPTPFD